MHIESEVYKVENINNLKLVDIFELEYIQRMQDMFSDATGVASLITYPDGRPVTTPSNFCRFCKDIIRKTEKGRLNCMKSDAIIGRLNSDGPIVQPCLSGGLWDAGASIKVGNKHIANWLIGQVRSKDADINDVIGYADEIGVDKEEFLKAWEAVPVMSEFQFQKIAEMLFVFANELSEKAYLNFQLKKEVAERKEAEEILQKSQESLSITLNSIGDGVISTDINGLVVEMNPVAQQLCGWRLQDAKGMHLTMVFNIINARTRKPVENPVNNVLKTGKILGLANHTVLLSKNGKEYQISDSAAPIKNKDGIIIGVVLVFSDVTEKYNAEEVVRQNEKRYSGLLNSFDAGVVVHAPDSSIVFSNFKATELLGLSEDQLKGKTSFYPGWHFVHESGEKMLIDEYPVNLIIANKKVLKNFLIGVQRSSSNDIVWLVVNGFPEFDRNGEISEIVISFIDITDRKEIENTLIEKDHFLNQVQLIAQLGTYSFDLTSDNWNCSAIMDSIFGIDSDYDKSFEGWVNIIHPEWQKIMNDYVLNEVIGEKSLFDKKYKIIRKNDHAERWVYGKGELVLNNEGLPILLIGSIQDITDRIESENLLRESEEKYRNIFENVQDVFFQIDPTGIILEISPSVKFYSDFEREEMIGRPVKELYYNPNDRELFLKNLLVSGELRDYEINLKSKSGIIKNGSLNARLVLDADGNILHINGSVRDITKRKMTENALRESEKKFHDYIKFAPHGVFIADENGKYTEVNAAASIITGYSADELLTMDQTNLIANESIELFDNHFKNAVKNGFATDELVLIAKNKSRKFVTVDTVKISEQRYIGFVVDISNRKLVEKALQSSESYLKETQLIAQLGTYSIFFDTGKWECSEILSDIFGLNEKFDFTIDGMLNILHPEWSKKLKKYFQTEVIDGKSKFDKKFKIIRPLDQQERWIHALGEAVFDGNDKPLKMIGTIQDITHRKNLAEALRSSEALYKSILNASPDAIIVVDIDGFIRMTSPAALVLYGVSDKSQLIDTNIYDYLAKKDIDRAKLNARRMFEEYIGTNEYQILKSNGTSFYADVNGDVIWDRYGQPTGMLFIIRDVSERKKIELSLVDSQNQLKKFASHLQNVREEERVLLASEIHDELGQILIAMKIDLGLLKQKVLKSSKNKAIEDILTKFDNVFELVDNTINTTRKIMTDLRPEVLYMLGFLEGIKFYSKKFEERHKIKCSFESPISELSLHPDQSIALFRVFQEALTNIVQHSKATEVTVLLNRTDGQLILEIVDNGVGFRNSISLKKDSYGIMGMRERVLLFDGELLITAQPGKGTKIKVKMPLIKQQINF